MDIQNVAAPVPLPALDQGRVSTPPAVPEPAPEPLAPAVRVDLTPAARTEKPDVHQRVSVDTRSRELLFQVVQGASGTVVMQIPDESAVRARVYAQEAAARAEEERAPITIA